MEQKKRPKDKQQFTNHNIKKSNVEQHEPLKKHR